MFLFVARDFFFFFLSAECLKYLTGLVLFLDGSSFSLTVCVPFLFLFSNHDTTTLEIQSDAVYSYAKKQQRVGLRGMTAFTWRQLKCVTG